MASSAHKGGSDAAVICDDLLFPCFFETALMGFEHSSDIVFSAASAIIMTNNGRVIRVPLSLWAQEGVIAPPQGLYEMIGKYPVPMCILFSRKVIETTTIDMHNPLAWDCDYLIQIAAHHPIFISKKPCGIFLCMKIITKCSRWKSYSRIHFENNRADQKT